jgi:hypothetical protein
MAVRAHAARIRRAASELPAEVEAIAADERLTRGERRAILEQLREELDPATPEGRAAADQIGKILETHFGPGATR